VRLLAGADIAARLTKRPGLDTVAMRVKKNALAARKSELATLFAEGVLDAEAVRRESVKLTQRVVEIDAQLTEAARLSTAATLLADGPGKVREHREAASPDIRGKVIAELMTVTVQPATTRGPRGLTPAWS
jgi:site-specific DNA recombinase